MCLVGAGFVTCENRYVAVALLTIAVGIEGLSNSVYMVNMIDFAPRYAGLLFGITNSVGTIPGMVAPIIAGALTPHDAPGEWRNVFYMCAAVSIFGAIVYGSSAETDLEPWAIGADTDSPFKDNEEQIVNPINNKEVKNAKFENSAYVYDERL